MGLIGFFVICIVIAVLTENDSCLIGLLSLGFGIMITVAAFGVNPILGIIVGFFVLQGWKSMGE